MVKNWIPSSNTKKFSNLFFFYLFGTAKRHSRVKFQQHVVLDVLDRPARPEILQNKIFATIFRENFRDRRLGGTRKA